MIMLQETLKKTVSEVSQPVEKSITLFIGSNPVVLNGTWEWNLQSSAVYCSDVMSFPEDFYGTKGIIHPDDLLKVRSALDLMQDAEVASLDFRIITTYGEVKHISGRKVSIEDWSKKDAEFEPEKEAWLDVLQQLINGKETGFLHLRKELIEVAEQLHHFGSWFINKETGETWYSNNVFRIYGVPPQSLNAHPNTFNSFIHPDDRITATDAFENAFAEEVPLHLEYRIVTPKGDEKYVRQITQWIYNEKGQRIFTGVTHDMTAEHLLTEEKENAVLDLKLHQQMLRFSEPYVSCGYWFVNLATRKAIYSDNYYRIYGLKKGNLPENNSFMNLVHPEDRVALREMNEKMYREHAISEFEYRIIRPDSRIRYLKQNAKVFISGAELIMVGIVQDVTVLKGFEKKIHELNNAISLQNTTAEMMEDTGDVSSIIWMAEGMKWSNGFYKMLGYKPGSVEPLPVVLYKSIHPEDLQVFKQAEILVANNQLHDSITFRTISKFGIRQLKMSFNRVTYGTQEVMIGVIKDISKEMAAEQQLLDLKNFDTLLQNSVTDAVIVTNSEHSIIAWNKNAAELTGINADDALYHNIFDVFPKLNEEEYLANLNAAWAGTEITKANIRTGYFKKSHRYHLAPFKNEKGEVRGVLHVVEDISREVELKQRLGERLNFIEGLIEASLDRIVMLDRHMNYIYWNRKAEEHYNLNKQKVIGKNILEIFPAFRNDPSYHEFRRALRGETVHIPATTSEDDHEYFETYLLPIKDDKNEVTGVLWIVHDLSKEHSLEQEILRLKNELAHQVKEK